jgi:quinol monooxygenase YgiN
LNASLVLTRRKASFDEEEVMIGIIATLRANPGNRDQLEAVLLEISARVRADEPGNLLYEVMRARNEKDVSIVIETYESDEAFKLHMSSPHMADARPRLGALLTAPPEMIKMDAVPD